MQPPSRLAWHDDHSFGQDKKRPGEIRTFIVIAITVAMMAVEITAGIAFNAIALLADGLHMASHAAALSVSAFAYVYARKYARDEKFSFGTGKVNALGGFAGAMLLGVFALMMGYESVERLIHPLDIAFNHALLVAVAGLVVNGVCVFVLGHTHRHGSAGEHDHAAGQHADAGDHNLRAAYFHVLADALTSVLAIAALLAGKHYGLIWMDPVVGIIGTLLVAHWSIGLIRGTSRILLDQQSPAHVEEAIREKIERQAENRVVDLHVWSIGPNIYAAEIVVVAKDPQPPLYYKQLFPRSMGLAHVIVEVHREEDYHQHGPECGHTAVYHDGDVGYLSAGQLHAQNEEGQITSRAIPISDSNPDGCTPDHHCGGHRAGHVHGPGCGHEAVPHGDHLDYLVERHLHHPHGDHCDDHGPIDVVPQQQ